MKFPVIGKIKKIQDVIRHISLDCQEVDRGALITFQVDEIDELTLRRLQRIALNGHVVRAEVLSWQPEFGESIAEAGGDGAGETVEEAVGEVVGEAEEWAVGDAEGEPTEEAEEWPGGEAGGPRIGQEVVITQTGEVGVVNDVSENGVLVQLDGADGALVPLGITEVELR